MFAHHRKRLQLLFAALDAVLTIIAFEAAYVTRTHLVLRHVFFLRLSTNVVMACFCAAVWTAVSPRAPFDFVARPGLLKILRQTVQQCVTGAVLLVLLQYLLRWSDELSRSFLAIFSLYALIALFTFRLLAPPMFGAFQKSFGQTYHVVLVGDPRELLILERKLLNSTPFRIQITGLLAVSEADALIPVMLANEVVDEIIFQVDSSTLGSLEPIFLLCDEEGVRVRLVVDFFPHVNSKITLDRIGATPLLTFSADPLENLGLLGKRAVDIAVAGVALAALAPLFAVLIILIKSTSPGPAIYRQTRCGLNGRSFTLYKLRSMVSNADELKAKLASQNERQVAFKMKHDPRVTPVGRYLRKFSLDELPQFYNVLRGDMSLVGPRPPLPSEVANYERWHRRRLRMRPGLTCLWAIMGRDKLDFESWMRADLFYIDNWSFSLDLLILLQTIPKVVAGSGAN